MFVFSNHRGEGSSISDSVPYHFGTIGRNADSIRIIGADMNALGSMQTTWFVELDAGFITLDTSHIGFIEFDLDTCRSLKSVQSEVVCTGFNSVRRASLRPDRNHAENCRSWSQIGRSCLRVTQDTSDFPFKLCQKR